jgi:hypothetical protein
LAYRLRTTLLITFLGVLAAWPQIHEDTSGLEQFLGFYEVSPGRVLYIQPNSELDELHGIPVNHNAAGTCMPWHRSVTE